MLDRPEAGREAVHAEPQDREDRWRPDILQQSQYGRGSRTGCIDN